MTHACNPPPLDSSARHRGGDEAATTRCRTISPAGSWQEAALRRAPSRLAARRSALSPRVRCTRRPSGGRAARPSSDPQPARRPARHVRMQCADRAARPRHRRRKRRDSEPLRRLQHAWPSAACPWRLRLRGATTGWLPPAEPRCCPAARRARWGCHNRRRRAAVGLRCRRLLSESAWPTASWRASRSTWWWPESASAHGVAEMHRLRRVRRSVVASARPRWLPRPDADPVTIALDRRGLGHA